jgi:hypothetical protein
MEQSAAIRFLALKGLKSKAICPEQEEVYGDVAPALATVKKWDMGFLERRTDLFDKPRSGPPLTHDLAQAIRSVLAE